LRLSVRAPVRGTGFPGSASGACRPVARSPRPAPLAPLAPQRIAPPCSPTSQLLWRSQTSLHRAPPASAHRLPDADRFGLRRRSMQRPPGSRTKSVRTCQGLRPRRADRMLALTHAIVLPSASQTASALQSNLSRLNGWPIRSPADASRSASRQRHARLGADVVRYSFIAVDLHHLLLAGLPAHPTLILFRPSSAARYIHSLSCPHGKGRLCRCWSACAKLALRFGRYGPPTLTLRRTMQLVCRSEGGCGQDARAPFVAEVLRRSRSGHAKNKVTAAAFPSTAFIRSAPNRQETHFATL